MLNVKNNEVDGEIGSVPSLLLGCHRARYAELLSPAEVAEMAADAGLEAVTTSRDSWEQEIPTARR